MALLGFLILGSHVAVAGTIIVGTADGNDTITDPMNPSVANCSLWEALRDAFNEGMGPPTDCTGATAPPNTIQFSSNFTITPIDLPDIVNEVIIEGPVTIDGSADSPIFDVQSSDSDLTLNGATAPLQFIVENCTSSCINASPSGSSVTVNAVLFQDNSTTGNGAAINAGGALTVNGSTFLNNSAGGQGGAIRYSGSSLLIDLSIFGGLTMGNSADGNGGALYMTTSSSASTWNIIASAFIDNTSTVDGGSQGGNGGGAIWANNGSGLAEFSIVASEFLDNSAPNGTGGAIAFGLSNHIGLSAGASIIDDLSAGGIFASHFNGNTAGGAAGPGGAGGAIHNRGDEMAIVASSFENNSSTNSSGGAIAENGGGDSVLVNLTMNNNTAATDGGAIVQLGGFGALEVLNSTIAGNSAGNEGGGIWNTSNSFSVENTIIANNTADPMGTNPGANCGGPDPVINGGNNLQSDQGMDTTVCGGGTPFAVGDPDLGPFQYNGGVHLLVETMALGPNSAAHGAGNNTVCSTFPVLGLDARDVIPVRPDPGGSDCDIGAFESDLGPPALDLMPDAGLDFMSVIVGQNSTLQATLTNTGDLTTNNVQVTVSGGDFMLTNDNCSSGSLAGMGSCTVDVVFTPAAAGAQSQTLSAVADGGLMDTISLDGAGQEPATLDLLPDAGLDFLMVETGMTSSQTATLTNTGDVPATGLMLSLSGGDFSLANDSCMGTVPANGSCTVDVVFGPLADGAQSETLDAMADVGLMDSITVTGTGFSGAALVLSPDPVDFMLVETGMSATLPIQLENTGGQTATNVLLSISGGDFSLANDTCSGSSLASGNVCSADVVFGPQADGLQSETVTASATGGLMDAATLTGTGFTPAALEIMPDPIDFMMVETNQTSAIAVMVSNTGGETTGPIALMVSGGEFSLLSDTCTGNTLGGGNSCSVDIEFAPTADGVQNESFSASDGGSASDSVPLTGNGFTPAGFDLTPANLDFMMVETGMSATLPVTLENTGGQVANNVQLAISGGEFSLLNDTCSAINLPAGDTCTADVVFAPTADGLQSESIMASGDDGLMDTSTLTGTGFTPADLSLTPDPVDFMMVETGMSSTLAVTLENTGGQVADNVALAVSGGDFMLMNDSCSGNSLPGGNSCTAEVVFSPQADGSQTESLMATADGGLMDSVVLQGSGFTPGDLSLTPDPLAFGMIETGTSATLPVTLTNSGGQAAANVALSISGGDFSLTNDTCTGATLGSMSSCSADVVFAPQADGAQAEMINATATGGVTAAAALTGTGFTPAGLSLTPDPVDFMSVETGTSATIQVTLENTGGQPANNVALALSGGDYTLMNDTCTGSSLPMASTCIVDVVFAPQTDGSQNESLLATADGGLNATANLIGIGFTPSGDIDVTPDQGLDFGGWVIGTTSGVLLATVENTGQGVLDNLNTAVAGDFLRDGGSCGATLGAGATCTVGVRFQPSVLGALNGTLTMTADGGASDIINLTGNGLPTGAGPISIQPVPVDNRWWLLLMALAICITARFAVRGAIA